jgi:hypothetical protein
MENDLVMLDKAGNVIQYPLKNVFDAINGAKTEAINRANAAKTEAINHANGKDAALRLEVEKRLQYYVKWALTRGNKNALAGNLWADMEAKADMQCGTTAFKDYGKQNRCSRHMKKNDCNNDRKYQCQWSNRGAIQSF